MIYVVAATAAHALGRLVSTGHLGTLVADEVRRRSWQRRQTVETRTSHLIFHVPSELTRWRAVTALRKEPETLDWIDQMPDDSVLWDIGANVGVYTVYAARTKRIHVVACEPSIFNLEALVRNINANELTQLVTVVPLPLGQRIGRVTLDYTSTEIGGAFVEMLPVPAPSSPRVTQPTNCLTVDALVMDLGSPAPTHMKIDVDGVEAQILEGATKTLRGVQEVLIEVPEDAPGEPTRLSLRRAGFTFARRDVSPLVTDSRYQASANELWTRQ